MSLPDPTEQAIDWFIRLHSGEAGTEEHRRFADWQAQDPAHISAYSAVEQLYGELYRVAQAGRKTRAAPPRSERRRERHRSRLLRTALAAAMAGLFALGLIVPSQYHLLDAFLSDYYTRTGEQREIRLADGSRVLLNTNSAVSVDYGNACRRIRLDHGQARFSVAADARRPFEAHADGLVVRALGTVFEVYRRDNGEIEVTVQEHTVAVRAGETGEKLVRQGRRIRYRPGIGLGSSEDTDLKQAAGWQQQRLWVNDHPLSELLAEVDRYRVGRVFVTDPALARLPVTGVFSLADPDAVVNSVGKALGLNSTRIGPWWAVLHR